MLCIPFFDEDLAMIGYVTLGTNDLARAAAYYDALMAALGATRMMETEQFVAWHKPGSPGAALSLTSPWDGGSATVGNGTMVALEVESEAQVKAVYDKAIELGGTDEGAPGPRGDGFYAGYFRDPDGNKLNVFIMAGN